MRNWHQPRNLHDLLRDFASPEDVRRPPRDRVDELARRAEAMGVTGRVTKALSRRLAREGRSLFEVAGEGAGR